MDNSDYSPPTPPVKEDVGVAVIGLGPGGLALAKSIAKVHPVCGFDYCWDGSPDPVKNIWWSTNPNDLSSATHFIIADSCSRRYTGREFKVWMTDMLWARCIIRAALEGRKSPATIIMASVVPDVGRTRKLLGEFHAEGHHLGVAPQLPLDVGIDDEINELPKIVAGIDRESMSSIRSLYRSVFGRNAVFHVGKMEQVEIFDSHNGFMDFWLRSLIRLLMEGVEERRDKYHSDDKRSEDEGLSESDKEFVRSLIHLRLEGFNDKHHSDDKRSDDEGRSEGDEEFGKGSPTFDLSEDSDSSTRTA